MEAIKPVFEELSKDELLVRCVGGYTQNPNESFNNLIWKNVPKNIFCGLSVLQLGVASAVLVFNKGQKSHLLVLESLGLVPGKHLVKFCNMSDWLRVKKANQRWSESSKEARKEKRRRGKEQEEELAQEEGQVYGAGAF